MLSDHDKHTICEGITSSDHDYFMWSSLIGEPFLVDGFVCYFDGVAATIAGTPLANRYQQRPFQIRAACVVDRWMRRADVLFVHYFGPERLEVARNMGFELVYTEEPDECAVDLFVEFDTAPAACSTRKLRQDINRATRNGIEVEARKQEFLTADQRRLISQLASRIDVEASLPFGN